MFKELKIDDELKELLPPLTKEEYGQLERNILKNGYQKNLPIFIWNGYIADGHNRYSICQEHNIEFTHAVLDSTMTKVEVMRWMIDTQLGRRSLSPTQRIIVAKKYEDKFREMARENYINNVGRPKNDNSKNCSPIGEQLNKINTEDEISKMANVGKGTIARFNVVAISGNKELK